MSIASQSDIEMEGPPTKRSRTIEDDVGSQLMALPSPTLQLTGHTGSVYSLQYSPSGGALASTSFDRSIFLWDSQYKNYNVLQGHKNAVLDCTWLNDETLASCGPDKLCILWDTHTGTSIRKFKGHAKIVNSISSTSTQLATVSDDATCCLWDSRQKKASVRLDSELPLTAVCLSSSMVYTGGLDNLIVAWDLRKQRKIYAMTGHADTITCLELHPDGTHVLSNAMDNYLKAWDIRPFCEGNRLSKNFVGLKHNSEKGLLKCAWSSDGSMVSCGSADRLLHIWDVHSTEELYCLPGHKGCVNTVAFHPILANVVASGASDKQIYVGELS
jgi:Prp8 binding protein